MVRCSRCGKKKRVWDKFWFCPTCNHIFCDKCAEKHAKLLRLAGFRKRKCPNCGAELVPYRGAETIEAHKPHPQQPTIIIQQPAQPTQVIKEKEVITKEVVMIPCKYCGALMPQTAQFCPHCGARRKA